MGLKTDLLDSYFSTYVRRPLKTNQTAIATASTAFKHGQTDANVSGVTTILFRNTSTVTLHVPFGNGA